MRECKKWGCYVLCIDDDNSVTWLCVVIERSNFIFFKAVIYHSPSQEPLVNAFSQFAESFQKQNTDE